MSAFIFVLSLPLLPLFKLLFYPMLLLPLSFSQSFLPTQLSLFKFSVSFPLSTSPFQLSFLLSGSSRFMFILPPFCAFSPSFFLSSFFLLSTFMFFIIVYLSLVTQIFLLSYPPIFYLLIHISFPSFHFCFCRPNSTFPVVLLPFFISCFCLFRT